MKSITLIILGVLMLNSCKKKDTVQSNKGAEVDSIDYVSFGKSMIPDNALSIVSMASQYNNLTLGDSINSKMIAKVTDVCQAKGCWLTLNLEDGQEVMVKFKDYGFFVPKDIVGKEVIINGKAYVKEIPLKELRHYAEDAGKSAQEIALIIEPKTTYSFEADGVLIKQ